MKVPVFFVLFVAIAAVFFAAGVVLGTRNALEAGLAVFVVRREATYQVSC
jgi:hypothetical protein